MIEPEDVREVLQALETAQDKMERLKQEREALLDANEKLLRLVEQVEAELGVTGGEDETELGTFDPEEFEYSYSSGWRPKDVVEKESMEHQPDPKLNDLDDSLQEIRDLVEQIRTYKNE